MTHNLAIVLVQPQPEWGGEESFAADLAANMVRQGHRVTVVVVAAHPSRKGLQEVVDKLRARIAEWHIPRGRIVLTSYMPPRIRRYILLHGLLDLLEDYDTVYFTDLVKAARVMDLGHVVARLARKGVKLVLGLHGTFVGRQYINNTLTSVSLRQQLGKRLYPLYMLYRKKLMQDVIIHAINSDQYKVLRGQGFHVAYLPNGIKCPNTSPREIAKAKETEEFTLIWIGRHELHQKGLDMLIKTVKILDRLLERRSLKNNVQLHILGRGSHTILLHRILQEVKWCRVEGFVDNPYYYLLRSHLLLNTSRYENLSLTVGEALTHGTLVIASDIAANIEYKRILGEEYIKIVRLKPLEYAKAILERLQSYLLKPSDYIELCVKTALRASRLCWENVVSSYERLLLE